MKRRPVLFGSAVVVTLWSAWIVLHGRMDAPAGVVAAATRAPEPRGEMAAGTAPVASPQSPTGRDEPRSRAARPRLAASAGDDTFAAREWVAPPPPPPPAPAAPPVPPPPPPPPPAPTLPYRFVGLLDEGPAARPRVFLSLGEKLLVAAVGDSLEGGYRLTAISAQELVFVHIQDNVTLKLAVAGGSS